MLPTVVPSAKSVLNDLLGPLLEAIDYMHVAGGALGAIVKTLDSALFIDNGLEYDEDVRAYLEEIRAILVDLAESQELDQDQVNIMHLGIDKFIKSKFSKN